MIWAAVSVLVVVSVLAVGLTLISLPGTWLLLLVAVLCWWLVPGLDNWWWLAGAGALALLGEAVEFFASVAGAKVGGSGKHGAWGAFIGGLVGAILGTMAIPIPVLGTIIGGVVGAGVLATLFEREGGKKTWRDSSKAGTGAAVGKLASTVLKSAVAGVMGVLLVAGGVWEALEAGPRPTEHADMLHSESIEGSAAPAEPGTTVDATEDGTDAQDAEQDAQQDRGGDESQHDPGSGG